jgi:predicted MFS family arabinose efflux permease
LTTDDLTEPRIRHDERLPWAGLLALFFAGFLSILNETLPAGLLPDIARALDVTEAVAGQTVTVSPWPPRSAPSP